MVTEYYNRHSGPGDLEWFTVTTVVDDPKYLTQPFITSSSFRREAGQLEVEALAVPDRTANGCAPATRCGSRTLTENVRGWRLTCDAVRWAAVVVLVDRRHRGRWRSSRSGRRRPGAGHDRDATAIDAAAARLAAPIGFSR